MVTLPATLPDWTLSDARPAMAYAGPALDNDRSLDEMRDLLSHVHPDCSYEDWLNVLMAVHAETGGSGAGLAIVDAWSARGSKYKGRQEIEAKWRSFRRNGITGATLAKIADDHGADLSSIALKYRGQGQAAGRLTSSHEGRRTASTADPAKPVQLPEITAASFAGKPVPELRFHDGKGLIPHAGVTMLFGDGGTGKSTVALQLAAATAIGGQWLGIKVRRGAVFYFSAEDPIEVTHRRLADYAAFIGADLADMGALHMAPMLGHYCVMATADKSDVKATPVLSAFKDRLLAIRPALAIIDNAIDVFAGDANSPELVKQFMHLLSGISLEADCPIVLLAHPSRAGMSSGTGDGNSVHWSNSARSRLYLTRVLTNGGDNQPVEDDPAARVLKVMKANYAATGDEIRMRWEDGCFVHAHAERIEPGDEIGAARKAERVFMHLLGLFERQGRHVSASPSNTYAPVVFAKHEQREGVSKARFERAMNSLFDQGKIEIVEHGPPSTRRRHLAIVEGVE